MNRPARLAPEFPTDDVVLSALPSPPSPNRMARLVPLVGLGAMVGLGALLWGSGMVARGPTTAVLPAMMLVSAIGMAMQAGAGRSDRSVDRQRKRYLADLERLSEQMSDARRQQRRSLLWVHPAPSTLWTLVGGQRMWERGRADSDFCHLRVGLSSQRSARRIVVPPVGPVDELDPVTADALRRFVHCHATVDDAPVALALPGVEVLCVEGVPAESRAFVRAIVCQLAVLHAPQDVAIAAVVGPGCRQHWDWLKWLPHNIDERGNPMVSESAVDVQAGGRHVVLISDGAEHRRPAAGTTVIVLGDDEDAGALRLHIDGDRLAVRRGEDLEEFASADRMTMTQARICARRLARFRRVGAVSDDLQRWQRALAAPDSARLRVALGTAADGELVHLDITEAADGGDGPHGLCIGATGSGKSDRYL